MNPNHLLRIVLKRVKLDARSEFSSAAGSAAPVTLLVAMVRRIHSEIFFSGRGGDVTDSMWRFRAALAQAGQTLDRAMEPLWELGVVSAGPTGLVPLMEEVVIAQLVAVQWEQLENDPVPDEEITLSMLADLAKPIVANHVATMGKCADVVELGRSIRCTLGKLAFALCRASAAVWEALLEQRSVRNPPTTLSFRLHKPASMKDAQTFRTALHQFADVIKELNINPATLPVGPEDVGEADSLRESLNFLLARQRELRRWTRPDAFAHELWSTMRSVEADAANRLLALNLRSAGNVRDWSVCDHEEVETELGDVLSQLRILAEASGLDWDSLLAHADFHVQSAIEEDELAAT